MWNFNAKLGAIWTLKSLNEFDESYLGMRFGEQLVLILSTYIDEYEVEKFTYLMLDRDVKNTASLYKEIELYNKTYYINYDNIYTGDRRSLNNYLQSINENEVKEVLNMLGLHFNFFKKKKEQKIEPETTVTKIPEYTTVYKYGMNVEFIPSKDVYLASNGKLMLSDKVKQDILNNVEPNRISLKYHIFPEQAVRIIKSKLKYQINHK